MTDIFTKAITRKPGEDCADGLTTAALGRPSYELLLQQHSAYVEVLRSIGLEVVVLDPLPGHPDAYFVEDTAVVTADVAVITNPGAEARKGEVDAMEPALARFRETVRIREPGSIDGGDVLQVGGHFFIGISERTDEAGAGQLGRILEGHGNTWTAVRIEEGLHLKASVNYVGSDTLLVTERFKDITEFEDYRKIILDPKENYAANTLFANGRLLMPAGYPLARRKLSSLGFEIIELEMSEAHKMDGGLTCMSIRF